MSPIVLACIINSVAAPVFQTYDVYAPAPQEPAGSITFSCSIGLFVTIDLSTGSGSYTTRTLQRTGGGTSLAYNLFLDAARTLVWGNGVGSAHYGPFLLSVVTSNSVVPVYARIPARQDVSTGSYSDTITVTISY